MAISTPTEHIQARRARFWRDFAYLFLRRPWATATAMLGSAISADFRERIMLAVTQVNGCGFCSWIHTRKALRAGVEQEAIDALLRADFGEVPEDQQVAVLFAQHWAATQGQTDPEARQHFEAHYGTGAQDRILIVIRFINTMNHMMLALEHAATFFRPRKKA